MRATPGASIDSHEAYVDAIVLLVPGNPSGTDVGTDDLAVDGVVMPSAASSAVALAARVVFRRVESRLLPAGRRFVRQGSAALRRRSRRVSLGRRLYLRRKRRRCACTGRRCTVDGRPFLPRVIQWNGEPLQFLSACGFNVVQLPGAPTPEQSAEAERLGLWFLAFAGASGCAGSRGVGAGWRSRDCLAAAR